MSSVGGSYYVEKWQKGSSPAKKWKSRQKRGGADKIRERLIRKKGGKIVLPFYFLHCPLARPRYIWTSPLFGLLGSKCSGSMGLGAFLKNMFLSGRATKSTFKHRTVSHGSVIWSWWWRRLFAHVRRSQYSWAKMPDVIQCNTLVNVKQEGRS